MEGRLPGAPWPLRGRDPGDEDGGVFSVFHSEAPTPPSATLVTFCGPVEYLTGPKRPHPFGERNPIPGSVPEERERGMPQPTRPLGFHAGAASGLSPERNLPVGLGWGKGGRGLDHG